MTRIGGDRTHMHQAGTSDAAPVVDTLDAWVPIHSDRGCRYRVLGFPHAGGSAAAYRSWRTFVGPEIDFCPVELPGRGSRSGETPLTSLAELVERIAGPIEPLLNVPFAFFGHSVGARIAFECAHRLRARDGRTATHLFLSGRGAPQVEERLSSPHGMTDDALIAMLRRLGGTPREVLENRAFAAALLPMIRADLALAESQGIGEADCLSCPVTAFAGSDDASVGPDALDAWRHATRGRFRAFWVPGGHFYAPAGVAAVMREILRDLATNDVGV
jgi:medium-chain acyl-[acyl-carrier-protein] hydrolase